MTWRPLSVRDDPTAAEAYDALHDGVPEWLVAGVARWIDDFFEALDARHLASDAPMTTIEQVEQMLRLPLARSSQFPNSYITPVWS